MIQLNELRLGNWVYNDKISKFPMQVVSLGTDYVYLDFDGNEGDVWEPDIIKEMCGVPLTEELLLKCGFKLIANHMELSQYHYDEFKITFENDSHRLLFDYYRNFHIAKKDLEIISLHQLQNLYFALMREELKIEL